MSASNVQLISSDGISYVVPKSAALISEHIKQTLGISDPDEELPTLDLMNINSDHLEHLVNFMKLYDESPFNVESDNLPEYMNSILNIKFITHADSGKLSLVSLLVAANNIQINVLKKIVMNKIFETMKGKTFYEIKQLFELPEDIVITSEEVNELRNQYSYLFEKDV